MQVHLEDYVWAAGVATDLVNTAPGVWHGTDQLPDTAALAAFLTEHDLGTVADIAPTAADVTAFDALRTRLRDIVNTTDAAGIAGAASALTGPAAGGLTLTGDLTGDAARPRWAVTVRPDAPPADRVAVVAGLGILGALRALGVQRFRPCASDTCSGVFIDTSRPGRRRYCMPDICGNRDHVAHHRARRAAGA